MTREKIFKLLNEVFCDVFDDETITVTEATTFSDIENWDSFSHITLIVAVEEAFDIEFSMIDVLDIKNIGEMVDIIEKEAR